MRSNLQVAFWQRLAQPFTTLVMMMLAIPFIFGPLRSSTMGLRFIAGALMGFGFHMINRLFWTVKPGSTMACRTGGFCAYIYFCFTWLISNASG